MVQPELQEKLRCCQIYCEDNEDIIDISKFKSLKTLRIERGMPKLIVNPSNLKEIYLDAYGKVHVDAD